MNESRRRFLALALTGAGLSGCLGRPGAQPSIDDEPPEDDTPGSTPDPTPTPAPGNGTAEPPADIELRELSLPDTLEVGGTVEVSATVANVGGRPATVEPPLFVRPAGSEWTERSRIGFGTVEPGATATATAEGLRATALPELAVRVGGFDAVATADVEPATLSFAEVFRAPSGVECSITTVEFADEYPWDPPEGTQVEDPGPRSRWAVVTVHAQNRGEAPATLPRYGEFALIEGENQYDPVVPADGAPRYEGGSVLSGVRRRGELLFEVPADLAAGDLRVAWWRRHEDGGAVVAHWLAEDG